MFSQQKKNKWEAAEIGPDSNYRHSDEYWERNKTVGTTAGIPALTLSQ